MSGTLLLERSGAWRRTVALLALTAAAAVLVAWPIVNYYVTRSALGALALRIGSAVLIYVLFRMLSGLVEHLLPARAAGRDAEWTLTETSLTLDGDVLLRESIRMVHCWRNRDALGNDRPGWTVNIETTGKNRVLRSLTEGPDKDRSARQLRALVIALGYGAQWREE